MWRNIKHLWEEIEIGTRWELGDGSRVRFWSDSWLPEVGPLKHLTTREISEEEAKLPSINFVNSEGNWNLNSFSAILPPNIISLILGVKPPSMEDGHARCFWDRTGDGSFTVNSAYDLLNDVDMNEAENFWSVVWKWGGTQRVRTFCG